MIPKKSSDALNDHPVKLIMTSNQNIFVFQDLDCKARFLTYNNGTIEPKFFEELTNDESILCYDENTEDWYLDDVELLSISYIADLDLDDIEFKDIELSKYIIYSNNGIIVNNIFII